MYQTEANIFIKSLQQEVEYFRRELLQLHKNPHLSFREESQTLCLKFLGTMERLRTKLVATVDEPTQALLMPHFREALRHATNIASYMTGADIEKTRKQVFEAKIDELYASLEMPLGNNKEEIDAILMDLRTLNPSHIDAFEKALNDRIEIYIKRLHSPRVQNPRAHVKPLQMLVAVYKDKVNTEAQTQIKKFKPLEADLRGKLAEFDAWAKGLKFVKVKAKPTVKDAAMAHVLSSPTIGAVTSAGIQSYARNLFTFIGDEENLTGIAQRGMEAYINKPAMIPKREHVPESFFSWRNRDKSHPLTAVDSAELSARVRVVLDHE
jgi:hypothetical protein